MTGPEVTWATFSIVLPQINEGKSAENHLCIFYFPKCASAGDVAFCIVTSALKNVLLYEKYSSLLVIFLTICILNIIKA